MAESEDPRRFPTGPPGTPLPRIWKVEPEPEDETTPKKKKKKRKEGDAELDDLKPGKKKSKKSVAGDGESEKKHVLREETPALDTYETRQRVRFLIGGGAVGLVLLVGFVVYSFTGSDRSQLAESTDGNPDAVATKTVDPAQAEREAQNLYERARQVADRGDATLAITFLTKVTQSYPKTKTAGEAREALGRPAKNLPLFLDGPAVVASNTTPAKDPAAKAPVMVVDATKAQAPDPERGSAKLELPANAAESTALASAANPAPAKAEAPSKPLPAGFRKAPGTRIHESGWPLEIVGDRDGAPMLLVPGGSYLLGRDSTTELSESPSHRIKLSTYYIDVHEVTARQFDLFEKESGKRTERDRALSKQSTPLGGSEDSPVVMVTARDAKDYAEWAGKRMPTEAQWEAAARGTDGRLYPGGNSPPKSDKPRGSHQLDPVESVPGDVSPFGVFDLGGNAWEWTKDWYDAKYHANHRPGVSNPTGPTTRPKSQQLTVKGTAKDGLLTKREPLRWDMRLPSLGFRCAPPVEGSDGAGTPSSTPGQPTPTSPQNQGVIPF